MSNQARLYKEPPDYAWAVRLQNEWHEKHDGKHKPKPARTPHPLAVQLEKIRQKKHLSKRQFAFIIGTNPITYQKLTTGENMPSKKMAGRLTSILGSFNGQD
jgi:DNA-binding transcriptional regulator YiaG